MANAEHVDLLQKGVKEFNAWRLKHPTNIINLSNANFFGANLTGVNLTGANLSGTNLTDANLSNAKLNGVDLTRATLTGVTIDALCAKTMIPVLSISRAAKELLIAHIRDLPLSN